MDSSAKALPLLKLPYLALKEISGHMNPADLLNLYLCSKKSEWAVETVALKLHDKYRLDVEFGPELTIVFENLETTEKFNFRYLDLKGTMYSTMSNVTNVLKKILELNSGAQTLN